MNRDELLALADRCEAAMGPSAELDARIRRAVYAPDSAQVEQSKFNGAWIIYDGVEHRSGRPRIWEGPGWMQPFTASLDAAMTLVPKSCGWRVASFTHEKLAHVLPDNENYRGPASSHGLASTTPLALCAAALRAKASQ